MKVFTKTQDRQLDHAPDRRHNGIDGFNIFITDQLKKLSLSDLNRAIRVHLQAEDIKFAFVAKDAEALREALISNAASPITFDAAKPGAILEEDKVIQDYGLDFKAEDVKAAPVEEVYVK